METAIRDNGTWKGDENFSSMGAGAGYTISHLRDACASWMKMKEKKRTTMDARAGKS